MPCRALAILWGALVLAVCGGCTAPYGPCATKHHHGPAVDFEDALEIAKHGRRLFYPYSAPPCPYYDYKSKSWCGPGCHHDHKAVEPVLLYGPTPMGHALTCEDGQPRVDSAAQERLPPADAQKAGNAE